MACVLELEAGKYSWCSCGHSEKDPFCDGGHKHAGSALGPLRFKIEEKKTVALCACKQTGNAPYCDGSHTKL